MSHIFTKVFQDIKIGGQHRRSQSDIGNFVDVIGFNTTALSFNGLLASLSTLSIVFGSTVFICERRLA